MMEDIIRNILPAPRKLYGESAPILGITLSTDQGMVDAWVADYDYIVFEPGALIQVSALETLIASIREAVKDGKGLSLPMALLADSLQELVDGQKRVKDKLDALVKTMANRGAA